LAKLAKRVKNATNKSKPHAKLTNVCISNPKLIVAFIIDPVVGTILLFGCTARSIPKILGCTLLILSVSLLDLSIFLKFSRFCVLYKLTSFLTRVSIAEGVKDVTSVIGAAQKRGHKVTYLLPTLPKDPNHKDFARRNELREALRAAVNVPIVDLGVATSSDGIHHSSYSQFASQIKPTATNAAPTTNAIPTPDANAEKINLTDAQNIIKPGSETLIQTFKNIVDTNKVGPDTEKKNTIAGVLMAQLSSQLKALDEMTGGKIGASSSDLNEALRYLEDEFNQGTSIFDLSSKAAVHKTQTMVNTPPNIQKTNQNILNSILKRQTS
jgi:hypothetical protein